MESTRCIAAAHSRCRPDTKTKKKKKKNTNTNDLRNEGMMMRNKAAGVSF